MNQFLKFSTALLTLCALGAQGAPALGENYVVDGRCVTITAVDGEQVSYEWRDGNASGSGSMDAGSFDARCSGSAPQPAPQADAQLNPSPGNDARVSATQAVDTDFAQQTLAAHNRFRCMHGVAPLQWSAEIAAYAQRWAMRGEFKHSDSYGSPLGPMGENLYGSSGTPSGADAASNWYSESRGYDYAREGSSATGHFTAMIWMDAKYVGCGRAGGILSCNYASGTTAVNCAVPNMAGCFTKQVRPLIKDAAACP